MTHPFDRILILDFGSQYTQLIARRIREQHVYSEIHPYNFTLDQIVTFGPRGIILSGGPATTLDTAAPTVASKLFELGVPILGICYGMQLTTTLLGGAVQPSHTREYGPATIELVGSSPLFSDMPRQSKVWMSHGDSVARPPRGFTMIARSLGGVMAAFAGDDLPIYGVQFHPEVKHTDFGQQILNNFVTKICRCAPTWTMRSFVDESVACLRSAVGKDHVILGLSGGVDSSVAAVLIHRAIGDQLTCIFVDNGLLRLGEADKVREVFAHHFAIRLDFVDAGQRFLERLKNVVDPEAKRKLIGAEFVAVFEQEAAKIPGVQFLAQGTLYPDVIESVSCKGPSAVIKSHHNVGGLPAKMGLKLLEPLRELFKDEVRLVGEELGLSAEVLYRQPFPGPGLAIRILGEVTSERLAILRQADKIVLEEIKQAGLYRQVWQSFAVLLPVKTVGVMGDERTYEHVIALRVVESQDGMTADWFHLPAPLLATLSHRIINEVRGVNRVVYDISSKPPATIEWE